MLPAMQEVPQDHPINQEGRRAPAWTCSLSATSQPRGHCAHGLASSWCAESHSVSRHR